MSGVAILRNRSIAPVWVVAAIVGIFVATGVIGTAIGVDVAPAVGDHYQRSQHSRHVPIQPFTKLNFVGDNVFYISQPGPTASLEIRTLGKINTSAIKVTEKDGVLTVDSTKYHPDSGCRLICPYGASNTEVVIQTPDPGRIPSDGTDGAELRLYGTGGAVGPFQPTYNL